MAFAGRFSPNCEPGSPNGELRVTANREIFHASSVRTGPTRLAADIRRGGDPLDAPALLSRWTNRGAAGLASLGGDYAFALIEDYAPRLTLALAPLTELELYYHWDSEGAVHFATHLPDLLRDVAAKLDVGAVARDLGFAAFAEDARTLYHDIFQVQPGTLIHFDGGERRIERIWSLGSNEPWAGSEETAAERLRDLLEQAVSERLSAIDGPKASLLSAGRDSSAVTAVAASLLAARGERIDAWTAAAFAGEMQLGRHLLDEAPIAARTAARFANIDHHIRRPARIDLCARLDAIHRAVALPILQPVAVAWCEDVWDASEAQGNCLLLSGDFGNYALSTGGLGWLEDVRREDGIGGWLASAASIAGRAPRRLRPLAGAMLGRRWRDRRGPSAAPVEAMLRGELLEAMHGGEESRDPRSYRAWLRDGIKVANGSNDVVHLGRRLEMTDPTRDRALVEFIHSLPSRLLAEPDDRRRLFDRAFGDLLPREVLRPAARGRQNVDWHYSYDPGEMRAGLDRYRQTTRVREMVDVDALDAALGRWPEERILSGPLWREMVLGVLPALALASFLFTRDN